MIDFVSLLSTLDTGSNLAVVALLCYLALKVRDLDTEVKSGRRETRALTGRVQHLLGTLGHDPLEDDT